MAWGQRRTSSPGARLVKRATRVGVAMALVAAFGTSAAQAATWVDLPAGPKSSYVFDLQYDGGGVKLRLPSPVAYVANRVIDGISLGVGVMKGPQDLFVDHEGFVYVADSGNNRILKLDADGNLVLQFGQDGEGALNNPQGVFVWPFDGTIYVADTGNNRIAKFDPQGNFLEAITAPQSALLEADFNFQPTKLIVDDRGIMYVINGGDYRGLMQIDPRGRFNGWFGANRVGFDLRRVLIRFMASEAQKEQLTRLLPPPHSNLLMGERGYIYTVSQFAFQGQIKKLSSAGVNAFPQRSYGEATRSGFTLQPPKFGDLAVDEKGIVTAVDSQSGRLYQYDQDGNLLAVFGGQGDQLGLFRYPTSVIVDRKGQIWVLDGQRNNIQIFQPTEFAQLVHKASALYQDGQYAEAADPWREVLQLNSNYMLAHRGLGKAYYKLGSEIINDYDRRLTEWQQAVEYWKLAMAEYRLGYDKQGYSQAFGRIRKEYIRHNFGMSVLWLGLTIFAVWGVFKVAGFIVRRQMAARGGY